MKILIFGNGWLGNKFKNYFSTSVMSTVDITNPVLLEQEIVYQNPDVVINCAGKTGRPNIDWCETHKTETWNSNVLGPKILSDVCQTYNKYLVHIGSGCVYEGDNNGKGWSENDPPNFYGSFYSITKIVSELLLKERSNILILRIRMPIDSFITKITKYAKVINEKNSFTILDNDFFKAVETLIIRKKVGIYNMIFPGTLNHEQILDLYKQYVDKNFQYSIMPTKELDTITTARRSNCVLNCEKILEEYPLPNATTAVIDCLKKFTVY